MEKEIEKIASDLLALLGVTASVSVKEEKDLPAQTGTINVDINPEGETGLLIGHQGETLNAIEMFLAMAIKQKTGNWVRVAVNVGDYRDKQEDYLKHLADETAQRAKETGEAQPLYNLTPSQRRVIHLYLSEAGEVETESLGEGRERYLIVKPKK